MKELQSNNNSSQLNSNTGQDQRLKYTTVHVPSGIAVDGTTDLNALFAAYPEESRRPQSVGVNVTQWPKRKAHPPTIEEQPSKKQKMNNNESTPVVAPAAANSSNPSASGNSSQDWDDAMDELLYYYTSF